MNVYDAKGTCDKIFNLSAKKGWSDAKLAKVLAVSPQAVSKWRRGVGSPSTDSIVILSDIFKVSLDDIMATRYVDIDYELEDKVG